MFVKSFVKVAVMANTFTPEDLYDLVHEKDPYVGALGGAVAGAAIGAKKGKPGSRSRAALIGAGLGAVGGGTAGHQAGKLLSRYQSRKLRRIAESTGLRSTPTRQHFAQPRDEN